MDLGTKLSKTGTGAGAAQLTTAYTAGTTFNVGATNNLAIWAIVAAADATMTSVEVKLQTSYDGDNWVDIESETLDAATLAAEQSITCSAASTVYAAIGTQRHRLLNYARVVAKATAGGALQAGDSVVVKVLAW